MMITQGMMDVAGGILVAVGGLAALMVLLVVLFSSFEGFLITVFSVPAALVGWALLHPYGDVASVVFAIMPNLR